MLNQDKTCLGKFNLLDIPALLLSAFIFLQSLSVVLFTKPGLALSVAAIPADKLGLQIAIFLAFLGLFSYLRWARPNFKLWPLTASAGAFYITRLALEPTDLTTLIAFCLLLTVLLFSLVKYYQKDLRLDKISLAFILSCLILVTSLCFIKAISYDFPELESFSSDLPLRGVFWLIVLTSSLCLILIYQKLLKIHKTQGKPSAALLCKNYQKRKVISLMFFALALFLGLFMMGRIALYKILSMNVGSFDFGLFNQMFEYMRRSGKPLSTLERDGLYSHFKVHFSPIFYLLLPIYAIIPRPETLNLLQIIIVASGCIPAYLLAKKLNLPRYLAVIFAGLYLLQTPITLGSYYDLHETCFYAPLMAWWFYALFAHKNWLFFAMSLSLLLVKEDAALYLLSGALFLFFSSYFPQKKYRFYALGLMILGISAFILISNYLNTAGDGVMYYRFAALQQYGGESFAGIIRSIFQNPANLLALIFEDAKLVYLLGCFASTGFLALYQSEKANYLLFLPCLIMNLATGYPYQYNYKFQYSYASQLFIWLAMLLAFRGIYNYQAPANLRYFRPACTLLLIVAMAFSFTLCLGEITSLEYFANEYKEGREEYKGLREALAALPRDQVIVTHTRCTTFLADVPELYDLTNNTSIFEGREVDMLVLPKIFGYDQSSLDLSKILVQEQELIYSFALSNEYLHVWVKNP